MKHTTARMETCYGPVSQSIIARAAAVQLLITDVDGVLSDGLIYMGNQGEELKAFHVRDGYGIRCLFHAGIEVAVVTGRKARLLEDRCQTLGIRRLYQGITDKKPVFEALMRECQLEPAQIACIGDDLIDWPMMADCGLRIAVADAHPLLRQRVDYITTLPGGRGAVREAADLLLLAQGKLDNAIGQSI